MVIRLVLLAGLSIAAGLDAPILSHEVRHLINEDDDFCPDAYAKEERLLYNIDIEVEDVGEGCGDDDLLKIGTILQQIVDEVEMEIPEYDNEDMQTTICKIPVVDLASRGLRLAESNRELANAGRYRYRGGGRCLRCRRNNNDRRLLQEAVSYETTCFITDMAIYDADLAETEVKAVGGALLDLKESALECPNLRAGKTLVMWAVVTLEECKAGQQEALYAMERARAHCQQAILASSEAQLQPLVLQAAEAFDSAMNAVDKVQKLYYEMQDKLETTDVCSLAIETTGDTLSVEGASSMAEMAKFSAEMSTTAVMKANEAFLQLRERAMECGDSMAGKQSIASARAQLLASRKAKKQAVRKTRISRSQAQQAKAATSQEELIQSAKMAEESSTVAFLAAERARYSYFLIRDELERPICGETDWSPSEPDNGSIPEQSPPVPNTGSTTEPGPPLADTSSTASPTGSPKASTEQSPPVSEPDNGSIPEQSPPVPNTGSTSEPGPPLADTSSTASPTGSSKASTEQSPPVPDDGSGTDRSPEVPTLEGGEMQKNEGTPLKQWLVKLIKMLYDRIPERLLNEFLDSKTCSLGGTRIYIHIDALELPGEEKRLITKEVCDNLSEIPGK